ncbi:hypothetical protein BKA70DRAFT_1246629 [Coprinopsis sp. MPI-PUGE-AT-0042]|nr:hypothetical protein BKA70DRAFT_1246629 [Coprinopsis sp. MPI-PUGE-AT-0042]
MDSFDNFQYDNGSSYGPLGIVDDTSSVYTANTNDNASVDLSSRVLSTWMCNRPEGKEGGATVLVVLVKPPVESPLFGEREGDIESSGNEYGQKALRRSGRDTRPDL